MPTTVVVVVDGDHLLVGPKPIVLGSTIDIKRFLEVNNRDDLLSRCCYLAINGRSNTTELKGHFFFEASSSLLFFFLLQRDPRTDARSLTRSLALPSKHKASSAILQEGGSEICIFKTSVP